MRGVLLRQMGLYWMGQERQWTGAADRGWIDAQSRKYRVSWKRRL